MKPVIDINKKEEVPLAFTHIRVADEERQAEDGTVHLHERDKSLYIEFAALDYDAPAFATYYYCLKGFDDKWIKAPAHRRLATYTNLRPGNYTFQLRYAPDGKHWLEETARLRITVALISIKPSGSSSPSCYSFPLLYTKYWHGGFTH